VQRITHQGVARDGPVVLRPVRATSSSSELLGFLILFFLIFRFWAVCEIKLAILSLHQLLYRLSRDNLNIFTYQIFLITLNCFLIFVYRVLEAT